MMIENYYLICGLLFGGLGAIVSFLHVAFNGFKNLPDRPSDNTTEMKKERMIFYIARVFSGAIAGFLITFWFMDDVTAGYISVNKLLFIQGISGISTNFLIDVSNGLKKLVKLN